MAQISSAPGLHPSVRLTPEQQETWRKNIE
jgi:hypothetical protein